MTATPKVLIGCDPEFFVRNPNSGQFISAHGMIPGDKYDPFPVPFGAVQVDGMALEFNILPAGSEEEFVHNIDKVMAHLRGMVSSDYDFVLEPTATFDPEYFAQEVPDEAKRLGCSPDFNAWIGALNEMPYFDQPLRTASGHIHIGWTQGKSVWEQEHFETCCQVARHLDYYLGCPSLIWDKDDQRRSMYGKAGAFRPKPYGMEYRVLSNAWLREDRLTRWVYRAAHQAIQDLWGGFVADFEFGEVAVEIINKNNLDWFNQDEFMYFEKIPTLKKLVLELL